MMKQMKGKPKKVEVMVGATARHRLAEAGAHDDLVIQELQGSSLPLRTVTEPEGGVRQGKGNSRMGMG